MTTPYMASRYQIMGLSSGVVIWGFSSEVVVVKGLKGKQHFFIVIVNRRMLATALKEQKGYVVKKKVFKISIYGT
jgi:hypothetical protein